MTSRRKVDIRKLVDGLSANELKNFVLRLAEVNEDARYLLVSTFSQDKEDGQMDRLKAKVDAVVSNYGNGRGFIPWDEVDSFDCELDDVLQQQAEALIQAKQYKTAFDFVCYVFQTLGEVDTEDDSCGFEMVADTCATLWREIIPHCPAEESKAMLQWFLDYPKASYTVDYLQDYTEDIAMTQFLDVGFLGQKLQELDSWIDRHESKRGAKEGLCCSYSLQQKVLYRLQIMQKLDFPRAEVQAYRARFHRFAEVRQQTIDDALAHGETEQALAVLMECKGIDKQDRLDRSRFLAQLVDLYKRLGRMDEYKSELVDYVFEFAKMDKFQELKSVCKAMEWKGYRDRLLSTHRHAHVRFELMKAEGMYKQLLQEVSGDFTLSNLREYEGCLKMHFPEQVRDIYVRHAQKEIMHANSRSSYQMVAGYLQHIRTFPDGPATAQAIADRWKTTYRRRPALVDELHRAGF